MKDNGLSLENDISNLIGGDQPINKNLHSIQINGNQKNGLNTLKSAMKLYMEFKNCSKPYSTINNDTYAIGSDLIYNDFSCRVEKDIALALGRVCHHIHQDIVSYIREKNIEFKEKFKKVCGILDVETFLYNGSDCVFPGVRRCINNEKKGTWKGNINYWDNTIMDDNIFPRHIWSFLSNNKIYSSDNWKKTQLNKFELAHVFGHKSDEKDLEKMVFRDYDENKLPYAFFTSASNVVLIPNGMMKPTDKLESVKISFYKRHIDLYGDLFYAEKDFDSDFLPDWYGEIVWNEPILVDDWKTKVDNLLSYRETRLFKKYKEL